MSRTDRSLKNNIQQYAAVITWDFQSPCQRCVYSASGSGFHKTPYYPDKDTWEPYNRSYLHRPGISTQLVDYHQPIRCILDVLPVEWIEPQLLQFDFHGPGKIFWIFHGLDLLLDFLPLLQAPVYCQYLLVAHPEHLFTPRISGVSCNYVAAHIICGHGGLLVKLRVGYCYISVG